MSLTPLQTQRYARHILLDEVGARGQERLLATSVRVKGTGPAAEEAARYLVAAGVGTLVLDDPLLRAHGAQLGDLNEDVRLSGVQTAQHVLDLQGSSSRLHGVSAALETLVGIAVGGET